MKYILPSVLMSRAMIAAPLPMDKTELHSVLKSRPRRLPVHVCEKP